MSVTKRTISLDLALAKEIERVARKEKTSFSGAIALLAEAGLRRQERRFKSWGSGDSGLGDLSIRLEEYLMETDPKDSER